jgi:hypothetical protein
MLGKVDIYAAIKINEFLIFSIYANHEQIMNDIVVIQDAPRS